MHSSKDRFLRPRLEIVRDLRGYREAELTESKHNKDQTGGVEDEAAIVKLTKFLHLRHLRVDHAEVGWEVANSEQND